MVEVGNTLHFEFKFYHSEQKVNKSSDFPWLSEHFFNILMESAVFLHSTFHTFRQPSLCSLALQYQSSYCTTDLPSLLF